ncbi:MAG: PIN domain-containing protein [Bryobacterales bacterium]|nr:PIN domain-containing protein [Bryobacterales bacterium]
MPLADTLLRLASPPALFEARWSDEILAEVTRTLVRRFGKSQAKALHRENAMRRYFAQALVQGHQVLVAGMRNHPKDRHVLAAAVACRADYVVTFNLKDFPADSVQETSVSITGPSSFLERLWHIDRPEVERRLIEQAEAIGVTRAALIERLAPSVPNFVAAIRSRSPRSRPPTL